MIPKDGPCPDCHWSDKGEAGAELDRDTVLAFALGRKKHTRNYAIFMVLIFATGFVGLVTAVMWFRVIYSGSLIAFVAIGLLTVATGILSVVLAWAKKVFPVDLNCPSCDIRLDELGALGSHCPSCSALLQ
jgi:hypothetical protein